MGTDFELFSSFEDAITRRSPWEFCNFDNPLKGAFRDCGPSGDVPSQWSYVPVEACGSLTRVSVYSGGHKPASFYLYSGPLPTLIPFPPSRPDQNSGQELTFPVPVELKSIRNLGKSPLEFVMEDLQYSTEGLWLEFGVHQGGTVNYIADYSPGTVYGFDSFEGLPEKWREGYEAGCFSTFGFLPAVKDNVVLVKGFFEDTLDIFLEDHPGAATFIHIDADLYSAAKFALEQLHPRMQPGTVIIFDEIVNFVGFDGPSGELRALLEFVQEHGVKYEWIGMNGEVREDLEQDAEPAHQAAAIRVLSVGHVGH